VRIREIMFMKKLGFVLVVCIVLSAVFLPFNVIYAVPIFTENLGNGPANTSEDQRYSDGPDSTGPVTYGTTIEDQSLSIRPEHGGTTSGFVRVGEYAIIHNVQFVERPGTLTIYYSLEDGQQEDGVIIRVYLTPAGTTDPEAMTAQTLAYEIPVESTETWTNFEPFSAEIRREFPPGRYNIFFLFTLPDDGVNDSWMGNISYVMFEGDGMPGEEPDPEATPEPTPERTPRPELSEESGDFPWIIVIPAIAGVAVLGAVVVVVVLKKKN